MENIPDENFYRLTRSIHPLKEICLVQYPPARGCYMHLTWRFSYKKIAIGKVTVKFVLKRPSNCKVDCMNADI